MARYNRIGSLNGDLGSPPCHSSKGVMLMSVYEALMVMFAFGTFIIVLVGLFYKMTKK
ncbi:putative holin-like toxin [Brevibacillus laterosporus]|uniref:Putative holin-like toxin n=1 Tax=Brevibacillus laterosporus TaxID=1465 RepID=A0A518VCZ2_BRELA|nr:putative holin-like toxin [Brevibacillus laterosporus]